MTRVEGTMFDLSDQRVTGRLGLRYEDVAQDGRVRLEPLPASLGVVWRALPLEESMRVAFVATGVLPILTRLVVEAGDGPFPIDDALEVEGSFTLAHARADDGAVDKVFLDIDTELTGRVGRTNLPPPSDAGARVFAGRVRAEHVFTKPFAEAGERKVRALEIDGRALVPPRQRRAHAPRETLEVAPSARAIEPDFELDPTSFALGLGHTDSNQHVNSLVYPRLFEEAALRRLASLGRSTSVLARAIDAAYRRPSFAGDELRLALRTYEDDGRIVCTGAFFGRGESDLEKARAYLKMTLD